MDMLGEIFAMQKALNDEIAEKHGHGDIGRDEWLQRLSIAMMAEMAELCDEVNYKWWKNPKQENEEAIREEIVDIFHFFVSMCLRTGMDAQELYSRYMDKNRENFDRQRGLSAKKGYAPWEAAE